MPGFDNWIASVVRFCRWKLKIRSNQLCWASKNEYCRIHPRTAKKNKQTKNHHVFSTKASSTFDGVVQSIAGEPRRIQAALDVLPKTKTCTPRVTYYIHVFYSLYTMMSPSILSSWIFVSVCVGTAIEQALRSGRCDHSSKTILSDLTDVC